MAAGCLPHRSIKLMLKQYCCHPVTSPRWLQHSICLHIYSFHRNNGYTNVPQCYVAHTLPILFYFYACFSLDIKITYSWLDVHGTAFLDRQLPICTVLCFIIYSQTKPSLQIKANSKIICGCLILLQIVMWENTKFCLLLLMGCYHHYDIKVKVYLSMPGLHMGRKIIVLHSVLTLR